MDQKLPTLRSVYMLRDVWNRSNKFILSQQPPMNILFLFRDRRRVAQQCWIRLHSSSNIALLLLGPWTCITLSSFVILQNLIGRILSIMQCKSQSRRELLYRPAHHCQHALFINSQHWANNVESCDWCIWNKWYKLLGPFARVAYFQHWWKYKFWKLCL